MFNPFFLKLDKIGIFAYGTLMESTALVVVLATLLGVDWQIHTVFPVGFANPTGAGVPNGRNDDRRRVHFRRWLYLVSIDVQVEATLEVASTSPSDMSQHISHKGATA